MPKLQIKILEDKQSLGRTTAEHAARSLRVAIRDSGLARIIAGASQVWRFINEVQVNDWVLTENSHSIGSRPTIDRTRMVSLTQQRGRHGLHCFLILR
jgi:uncharacterized protein YbbK (DUF523 family)